MDWFEFIVARFNYWIYVILMMIGLYAMIVKNNLLKKLIGMSIFQTAIILFFVSIGVKTGSTIPILKHEALGGPPAPTAVTAAPAAEPAIEVDDYANPLPHVLMLTAIVVGVSTLGVGLAIVQKLHKEFGSTEESEILARLKSDHG